MFDEGMNLLLRGAMQAGWLGDAMQWIADAIKRVWDAFIHFLKDLILLALDGVLALVAVAVNALPSPGFLQQYSLGSVIGAAGPTVGWIVGSLGIGEALGIIAAAYAFRLLRKFFTFFQW